MPDSFESYHSPESREVPRPGPYKVKDTPEVKDAGGLKLREIVLDEKKGNEAGEGIVHDKVVRIPAGASINVERVFYSKRVEAPFAIVTFTYHNAVKNIDTAVKGCVNMNYLEKAAVAEAADPLQKMRMELQALQSEIGGKKV
jgi:hypothetical protein